MVCVVSMRSDSLGLGPACSRASRDEERRQGAQNDRNAQVAHLPTNHRMYLLVEESRIHSSRGATANALWPVTVPRASPKKGTSSCTTPRSGDARSTDGRLSSSVRSET